MEVFAWKPLSQVSVCSASLNRMIWYCSAPSTGSQEKRVIVGSSLVMVMFWGAARVVPEVVGWAASALVLTARNSDQSEKRSPFSARTRTAREE